MCALPIPCPCPCPADDPSLRQNFHFDRFCGGDGSSCACIEGLEPEPAFSVVVDNVVVVVRADVAGFTSASASASSTLLPSSSECGGVGSPPGGIAPSSAHGEAPYAPLPPRDSAGGSGATWPCGGDVDSGRARVDNSSGLDALRVRAAAGVAGEDASRLDSVRERLMPCPAGVAPTGEVGSSPGPEGMITRSAAAATHARRGRAALRAPAIPAADGEDGKEDDGPGEDGGVSASSAPLRTTSATVQSPKSATPGSQPTASQKVVACMTYGRARSSGPSPDDDGSPTGESWNA